MLILPFGDAQNEVFFAVNPSRCQTRVNRSARPILRSMAGESFDASSEPTRGSKGNNKKQASPDRRQFLGVQFDCCRTYSRIYINRDRTAFVGHCPKCGKQIHVKISPDGMDAKFFSAS